MSRNQLFRKLIEILKSKSKLEQKPIILPKKTIPIPPKSWECCGDSCPNCVWDLYFNELEKFNKN